MGLSQEEILIPQLLKKAGYATGCFGKWNIRFAPGSRPTERGFDAFLGHVSGNMDYEAHVYNGKHDLYRGVDEVKVKGYATGIFAKAASEFIREHQERPWFVYLPFNAPHFPNAKNKAPNEPTVWQAPQAAFAAYGEDPSMDDPKKRYRAVVTALDSGIGLVLKRIDELGLKKNIFVFFISDNGAFMLPSKGLEAASNAPLRDGGITCWEGGIRVPAIVRWPGRIASGTTISEMLWSPDLFVAATSLARVGKLDRRKLDGKNPIPTLTGKKASPHRSLYFTFRSHAGLRQGDWKIVRTRSESHWMLYHLRDDIGETINLADKQPDQLWTLTEEFQRWQNSF